MKIEIALPVMNSFDVWGLMAAFAVITLPSQVTWLVERAVSRTSMYLNLQEVHAPSAWPFCHRVLELL